MNPIKDAKVVVTGSRDWDDYEAIKVVLDSYHRQHRISQIIHGACRGADLLAERWAKENEIMYLGIPAKWKEEGKRAGPRRNVLMTHLGDVTIGFPHANSTGTYHAMKKSYEQDKPTYMYWQGKVIPYDKAH